MPFWSPRRIGVFLVIWTFLWPLYIVIIFQTSSTSLYSTAVLWGYLPGNPFSNSPLVIDILWTFTMVPFSIPALLVAYFSYRSIKYQTIDRVVYGLILVMIQILHMALILVVMPCIISTSPTLCLPVPMTGFVALPFAIKLKRLGAPWKDKDRL